MRAFLLVTFHLFAISIISFSQVNYYYYPVNSGTTNNLFAISNTMKYCLAVGANGTVLKTSTFTGGTNLGVNWSTIPLGTNEDFKNSLMNAYINLVNNYIFGNNGILYSTTNMGLNWTQNFSGTNINLNCASFANGPDTILGFYRVIIVGNSGTIITKCENPDSTLWWKIPSGTTNNLKCVYFGDQYYLTNRNRVKGWITGSNGTLLKTTDRGLHWASYNTGFTEDLNAISFCDTLNGLIAGNHGLILKTTNGGTNWFQILSGASNNLNNLYIRYINGNGTNNFISFAVGQSGTVLTSTNMGTNWSVEPFTPTENINSVTYFNSVKNKYWFVTDNGKIYSRGLDTFYHTNEDVILEANNIRSHFSYKGIFDNNKRATSTPGFEWPKGSNNFALYSAGLNIAAKVNGELREAMCSYIGEFSPGYCSNGNFNTNLYFKIYKVSKSDNAQNNWDWANWGQMVPFGAPYIDVNNNNIYEPAIDTPGVKNAKETIFLCMTDANPASHDPGEGFGGGTLPLGAEIHMVAWAYDVPALQDVQFISYDIINKSLNTWNATQMSFICDADLGDNNDDYTGCDTVLKLGYCYNADNYDAVYGTNPPAVGLEFLVSPLNRNVLPNKRLGLTSFAYYYPSSNGASPCISDLGGEQLAAYRMLMGYKKDSTCFLDPTYNPPKKTKICLPGDPETNSGWTATKGRIHNCNKDSSGTITYDLSDAGAFIMSSGESNFNVVPGESQKFVIAQLIARGSNNLNSVTVLKNLSSNVKAFYEQNFPVGVSLVSSETPNEFKLMQNYPNPFNPITKIKYQIKNNGFVTLKIYNILGKEIETLVNESQNIGTYEITFDGINYSSGVYFYKLVTENFSQTKKMVLLK